MSLMANMGAHAATYVIAYIGHLEYYILREDQMVNVYRLRQLS